ncbi:DUF2314 domain-containing protein [Candidatus Pacearchaeota archaeon]|nr:DUF2314 domain-containing protein [Candidatus Pacearchaeota archaeon]
MSNRKYDQCVQCGKTIDVTNVNADLCNQCFDSMNNVEYLCETHSNKRHENWTKNNKNKKIVVGDIVKVACKDEHTKYTEHMWFQITEIVTDNKFKGQLNNYPLKVSNIKFGDTVIIDFIDIEDFEGE